MPTNIRQKYENKTKLYSAGILKEFRIRYQIPPEVRSNTSFIDYLNRNHYLKFSFVRHPFDRIVSAYRDKVIKHKEKWLKLDPKHHDFESFVKYVIMECQKFRKNLKRMNTHWRPYYNKCGYCDVDYDVIGRAETFIDDTR